MSRLSRLLRSRRRVAPPEPRFTAPFEHLLHVPRYELQAETVAGDTLLIPDGASFYASYREIFTEQKYRFQAAGTTPRIVDCGANCGLSVLYFKQLFPAAEVVAVEADPHIFRMLQWNIRQRGMRGVTLVNKAVAVGSEFVTFHREGADAGRIHALCDAKEQLTVPIVVLDDLLVEPVDLLKIDIEGSETDVVCSSNRLSTVSQIILEYHSFADHEQSLQRVLSKLAEHGFRYYLQTQYCPARPLVEHDCHLGMDLQVNVFAKRPIQIATAGGMHESPLCQSPPDDPARAA